jgi:hypothetical protein
MNYNNPPSAGFLLPKIWRVVYCQKTEGNIMHDLKDRLKEPSSYLGLASVFQGIGECLQGNYESGIPLVFLGLVGIFKAERGNAK